MGCGHTNWSGSPSLRVLSDLTCWCTNLTWHTVFSIWIVWVEGGLFFIFFMAYTDGCTLFSLAHIALAYQTLKHFTAVCNIMKKISSDLARWCCIADSRLKTQAKVILLEPSAQDWIFFHNCSGVEEQQKQRCSHSFQVSSKRVCKVLRDSVLNNERVLWLNVAMRGICHVNNMSLAYYFKLGHS